MNAPTIHDHATRAEAAAYLRVSEAQLRKWEAEGIGPKVLRISPRKALYSWNGLRLFLADGLSAVADGLKKRAGVQP